MGTARKSDAESIDSVLNGDVDSFGALYGRYYSSMVAIAYSVLKDHHLAEDAAQEGFLKALRNLQSLRRKDRFAPWLARLCRNVARDVAQANSKSRETDSVDVSELDPPERRVQDDVDRAVRQALDSLSASARELLVLRYYDNLSYEQISPVLGISKAAINSRLKRAKRKIAVYLHRNGLLEK
jgi:RNA polymerase sigma-70 factor (ECF subfamily)